MIKKILIIILPIIFCFTLAEGAEKVLVLQSIRIKPYDDALKGFKSVCDCTTKKIVLSEINYADFLRNMHKIKPDMILSIGVNALIKVKDVRDIPIVYVMVLNPQSIIIGKKNITGVSMNISPEKQLNTIMKVFPEVNRVGLIYDINKTADLVKDAQNAAKSKKITLIKKEAHNSKEVLSLINDMKGEIDVFWMLPDTTVITPEAVEFLLSFSLENKVPIFTFSDKYVEIGALMSLSIDAYDLGKQTGEMAKKILSGTDVKVVPGTDARKTVLSINLKVAKKLGMTVNDVIINKARIIN